MNKLFYIVSLILLTSLYSCKSQKKRNSLAMEEAMNRVIVQEIDFLYFTSKSKIDYKDADNDIHATANIRILKDSIIWLSITPALGIEAARCLIRKDSIFVIDRLNNQFLAYDFIGLSKKFNIDFNFYILQAIILGNLPVKKSSKDKLLTEQEPGFYILQQNTGNLTLDNYINSETMALQKLDITQQATKNHLSVKYDKFGPLGKYIFAYDNTITIGIKTANGEKSTLLHIDHNKADLPDKEINFPFNIPKRYEGK